MNNDKERQKALNLAFYATIFTSSLSLLMVIVGSVHGSIFAYLELIGLPILGYLTKKSNKKAALFLIIVFLIDRVMLVVNWLDYISTRSNPLSIIQLVVISFILWSIYFRAYQYLKRG